MKIFSFGVFFSKPEPVQFSLKYQSSKIINYIDVMIFHRKKPDKNFRNALFE